MERRAFLAMLGSAASVLSGAAGAQTPGRKYHLATLTPVEAITEGSPLGNVLLTALAQYGYALGQNLTYTARSSLDDNSKIPGLLQELKADGADAFVVIGFPAALAAKSLGIPTIGAQGVGDPVETGLIYSLSHPGGNITGISDMATTLTTKRLSFLKQVSPNIRKVAMLWNPNDLAMSLRYQASAHVAGSLGISVQAFGIREPDDFGRAFEVMNGDMPDAILMVADALTNFNRKRVIEFALARKVPAIYEYDFYVQDGGLMSYGPDLKESFERAAALVARIFGGAKPAELPFEQPTLYTFALNLKTARSMGLQIPPTLLALADEVIE